ncbi:MAG TPA: glycosyltransferase family 4 protein [Phycisphaeraceae bacterium]
MRALVLAPQPFFTPRGTPFSVYYRTLVMSQLGVEVDVLTYGEGEEIDLPGVRVIRIPHLPFLGPVRVGPSKTKIVLDVFMLIWTIALLARHRYDYVHAHEEAVFWCLPLQPLFGFKLAYDMHSSLPQQLVNFQFTRSRLLIGLFKRLEDAALRRSDAVITICPALRDYALAHGVDPQRHFLIENSIFEDVRLKRQADSPADAGAAPPPPAIGPGPRIVYTGTFEPYQGLDLLIHAFAQVHRSRPDAKLVLVGGTPQQVEQMRELARGCNLDGACVFTGRVSKPQARAHLESADVLVSPRRDGTNTPLKIYEQLASGKPLVATRIWSHTQVLDDRVCFLVDPTPQSMAQGLLDALNQPDRARELAQAARRLYETAYARSIYEQKMQQFLSLLKQEPR